MSFFVKILVFFLVFAGLNEKTGGGDTATVEKGLANRDDIIFFGGFEESFNDADWRERWGIRWTNRNETYQIVGDGFQNGKSLRINYPEGGLGPGQTGGQFPIVFNDIKGIKEGYYQELYFRYYLKFEEGFDFNKGGKLPGLMGGGDSWSRSGGNQPDGTNGWTLRFMWRAHGEIVIYAYVPKSANGKWGGDRWGQDIPCYFKAEPGKWHCIEQYVHVGTPGNDDGTLAVWIDGVERLKIDDMRFWSVDNVNGLVGGICFSTFHGGNTVDWAPRNDSFMQYDGFVAARKRVGEYIPVK